MADLGFHQSADPTEIIHSDSGNRLWINADGSINVASSVITPVTGVSVDLNIFGNVSSTAGINTFYVIPNGTTLTIQRMSGGAEPHSSGTIVELFEDPNGNLSVLNRIETIFVNGASTQVDVNVSFLGNGTRRIVLRRRVYASASREVWGRWTGYYI